MEGTKYDCVLSDDNIYEILIRVTASSLPSCLAVCKSWLHIGYEPCFDALRSRHTTIVCGFVLQSAPYDNYNQHFLIMDGSVVNPVSVSISSLLPCRPQALQIIATIPTIGLLLCVKPGSNLIDSYHVTQLGMGATPCHYVIPNPKTRFLTHCIALVPAIHQVSQNTNEFKIVRIAEPKWGMKRVEHLIVEIFDSVYRKWRRFHDLPSLAIMDKVALVINQTAYWMVSKTIFEVNLEVFSKCSIFAFNVEQESGRIITGPDEMLPRPKIPWEWKMVNCEERLCLVHMLNEDIKVWMMMIEPTNENIERWEFKGSFSKQYIRSRQFLLEENIRSQKVVLLETLYRELWYELVGCNLIGYTDGYADRSVFKMHLDRSLFGQVVSK